MFYCGFFVSFLLAKNEQSKKCWLKILKGESSQKQCIVRLAIQGFQVQMWYYRYHLTNQGQPFSVSIRVAYLADVLSLALPSFEEEDCRRLEILFNSNINSLLKKCYQFTDMYLNDFLKQKRRRIENSMMMTQQNNRIYLNFFCKIYMVKQSQMLLEIYTQLLFFSEKTCDMTKTYLHQKVLMTQKIFQDQQNSKFVM